MPVNYTYLVNEIIAACEDDGAEFLAFVPYAVNRAEEKLTKDLDDYGLVTYTSVAVSNGNNLVTLPSGTRVIKNFNIISNGTKINLLPRTDEFINDYWPVSSSTGEPKYYARRNNTTVLVAPTPASTYDGTIVEQSRPTALSSASQTNYFTDFCYDTLFLAAMEVVTAFQKDFAASDFYKNRYNEEIQKQQNQARRTRRDDTQAPASPAGGDNTLKQGA